VVKERAIAEREQLRRENGRGERALEKTEWSRKERVVGDRERSRRESCSGESAVEERERSRGESGRGERAVERERERSEHERTQTHTHARTRARAGGRAVEERPREKRAVEEGERLRRERERAVGGERAKERGRGCTSRGITWPRLHRPRRPPAALPNRLRAVNGLRRLVDARADPGRLGSDERRSHAAAPVHPWIASIPASRAQRAAPTPCASWTQRTACVQRAAPTPRAST
jgi:hypothetical protein